MFIGPKIFNVKEAREKFDDFLLIMDDPIEMIEAEAKKKNICLVLDMKSLENPEELFFQVIGSCDDDGKLGWMVSFARYLGEIVITSFHGNWQLSLDDPKDIYFNTPVIVNHATFDNLQFSPIFAIRALSLRRKNGLLRQIIMADITPRELNIDHLEEE